MKKYLVAASLAAMVAAMSVPAQAAANVAVAGPGASASGFLTTDVTLSQDAPAFFVNADIAPHDFVEKASGGGSNPNAKFYTAQGGAGVYPVQWRGNPAPGEYRFVCTIHGNMVGTATVL